MPLPTPSPDQTEQEFLQDCMSDKTMIEEFPGEDQRYAVCQNIWDENMDKNFVKIKKADKYKQVVMGIAYGPPGVIDSHGDTMTKEDIEYMAYDFMKNKRMDKIDVGHNFEESGCHVVESFIARKNDPDFTEGSWVLAVWCPEEIFQKVLNNELNGFSFGGRAATKRARVMLEVSKEILSETSENTDNTLPKHFHNFVAYFDQNGEFLKGKTDVVEGHWHEIMAGTRTETSLGHSHRLSFDD